MKSSYAALRGEKNRQIQRGRFMQCPRGNRSSLRSEISIFRTTVR